VAQENDGQHQDDRDHQHDEEIRDTPMFQPPDSWVSGSARHLSPLQFFACTNEPRADLDGLDLEGFGLTEERCTTVEKNGVRVFNRFYSAIALQPYMTGDKSTEQRELFIRYDRALAARGVLREVEFVERNEHGIAVTRLLLRCDGPTLPEMSPEEMYRARNGYLRSLVNDRDTAQRAVMAMAGEGFADKLINEVKARARRQKNNRPPPAPAAPIFAPGGEDELAQALDESDASSPPRSGQAQRSAWMPPGRPGKVPGPAGEDGAADSGVAGGSEVSQDSATAHADDELSSLDEALGGSIGFLEN
jgi:hypothetical protein